MTDAEKLATFNALIAAGVTVVPFYPADGFPLSDGFMIGADDGKSTLYPTASEALAALVAQLVKARADIAAEKEKRAPVLSTLTEQLAARRAEGWGQVHAVDAEKARRRVTAVRTRCCRCFPRAVGKDGFCGCCMMNHATGVRLEMPDPDHDDPPATTTEAADV